MSILGQANPGAAADADVYTVPAKKSATVRVFACEVGAASATIQIAVRPDGAAISNLHRIIRNRSLAANGDFHTAPIDIGADDVITVQASTANVAFTVTGVEEPERE